MTIAHVEMLDFVFDMIDTKSRARHRSGICLKWSLVFIIAFTIVYTTVNQLSKASLYGVFNIFTVDFNDASLENPGEITTNYSHQTHVELVNIATMESELLRTRLKIFFVQTSENDDILPRHGCSIEAAARVHPHNLIFVLMRSQHISLTKGSYIHLRSYNNIRFVHFDEQQIYSGTSLARLNTTSRKQFIRYFAVSHMSDFIRTALLYKYGGIYFDLDVIPLKAFDSFTNVVGLETSDGVNVAVLAFERQHIALDIQMDLQLNSVADRFQALCWNCVGPSALSDALKQVCDSRQLHVREKDKCHQIDIQPSFVFYPIPYQQIPQFFRRGSSLSNIDYLLKNASIYSIHYFHHMTMNLPVEIMSPFAQLAQIYCPAIFEQLIDHSSMLNVNKSSLFPFANTYVLLLCLLISLLCIVLLILAGTLLAFPMPVRVVILALQHKFNIPL